MKSKVRTRTVRMTCIAEFNKFEPGSCGFRPAYGCHDAIEAIAKSLVKKEKWVLDADITGCFDNIDHDALLDKIEPTELKLFGHHHKTKAAIYTWLARKTGASFSKYH